MRNGVYENRTKVVISGYWLVISLFRNFKSSTRIANISFKMDYF
jgi:hypothetical protein